MLDKFSSIILFLVIFPAKTKYLINLFLTHKTKPSKSNKSNKILSKFPGIFNFIPIGENTIGSIPFKVSSLMINLGSSPEPEIRAILFFSL